MLFICYPKCGTCQKAKKWLEAQGIAYTERLIHQDNPTYEELKEWQKHSDLPLKKFFNTSGLLYKSMQLKDKLPQMSDEEQLKLLATDGMLVKRPILVLESEQESKPDSQPGSQAKVLVGFKEAEWAAILAEK
ncbi:MAG: arsenate reductase family protein [Lachnospiraceae bacterium]|nr:arsenate reductase family protein [Lachnospiraceae bacterium]